MVASEQEPVMETQMQRVSMVWPADLKEQVRALVGSRGLTEFTLDAVREKLAQMNRPPAANGARSKPDPEPSAPEPETEPEPPVRSEGFAMDPAEVAKLPLARRMAYARSLIHEREGAVAPTGLTAELAVRDDRCPKCRDELVNGECWTCPPV